MKMVKLVFLGLYFIYTGTNWVYKNINRMFAFLDKNSFSFTNIFKIERNEVR